MKLPLLRFFVCIFLLAGFTGVAVAKEHGFVMSIPDDIVAEQLYRVNVQRINGKNPMTHEEYWVPPGETTVTVSLIFNSSWAPKLEYTQGEIYSREFKFTVEEGKTYQIAGKVNPNASMEEQKNGSFWEPVIYKVQD